MRGKLHEQGVQWQDNARTEQGTAKEGTAAIHVR